MPLKGDIKKLTAVAKSIRKLSEVPNKAARAVAKDIAEFIEDEFDGGADPYGRAWAPLLPSTLKRHPGRGFPPLTASGDMRDSVNVEPVDGQGVVITIKDEKSLFHQFGTVHMVARRILPNRGLPALWREAISASVKKAVKA